MIKNAKMVLFDVGQFVVLKDEIGNEVSFESFQEFTYFSGVDISSKYQVNYEPMTPVFYDSEGEMTEEDKESYEVLITRIVELSDKKNNPYYDKTPQEQKDLAYSTQIPAVEQKKQEENLKDFPYNGAIYKSDKSNIQSVQNECLGMVSSDKIRTMRKTPYEGSWKVTGGYVPYIVSEFIVFATAYFLRGSDNFTNRCIHMANIAEIYEDESKTAQDILDYDFSGGWE